MEAVEAEISARLGPNGRAPNADDLRAMPYGSAVVNETLRLWPPAPLSGRRATTAFDVGGWARVIARSSMTQEQLLGATSASRFGR